VDAIERGLEEVAAKAPPALGPRFGGHEAVRALFVPGLAGAPPPAARGGPIVATARDLLE